MGLYIRIYEDYSYEIIFTEGRIKKKRIHILINPGKHIVLQGQGKDNKTEINVQSLTHILGMETSVINPDLIKRIVKIAELTNKPIITNTQSSEIFKKQGISIRQMRIMGFDEEVIDGVIIDPIYKEELENSYVSNTDGEVVKGEKKGFFKNISDKAIDLTANVPRLLNPLKWKPIKKIKETVKSDSTEKINPKNPLAIYLKFSKTRDVIIPLDHRAIDNINEIIPEMNPELIILPNLDVSQTYDIKRPAKKLLIANKAHKSDKVIVIPKTHNPSAKHDTIYSKFEEWIDLDEIY